MNNEHLLKILKHNLEVMPSRIYCPVVESENIGGAYREGYEQALDDVKEQVEGIIEDEEITWLSQHDRITGLEKFNGSMEPWFKPKFDIEAPDEVDDELIEEMEKKISDIVSKRIKKFIAFGEPFPDTE